jgi:hypothetical protein
LSTSATDPPEQDRNGFPPVAYWYYLDEKPDFSAIEGLVVFMIPEVERFEAAHKESEGTESHNGNDKPLTTRERNTLLTLVYVLADLAKVPLANRSKAAEMIANHAAASGLKLPVRTIVEKLKLCQDAIAARSK